jgi:hypothetical protein
MFTMKRFRGSALALLAVGTLAACDNPVGEGSHIRPDAFEIRSGGEVLVHGAGLTSVTGSITVAVGQELPLSFHYLRNGQELTVPYGYWLDYPAPAALAAWEPTAPGAFTGMLRGVGAGVATVRVELVHGPVGSGHEDHWANVLLTVTP